jgi:hypothetical protein
MPRAAPLTTAIFASSIGIFDSGMALPSYVLPIQGISIHDCYTMLWSIFEIEGGPAGPESLRSGSIRRREGA